MQAAGGGGGGEYLNLPPGGTRGRGRRARVSLCVSWRHAVGALSARVAGRAGHHLAYIGAEIAISRDELSLGQEIQIADRH